MNSNLLKKLYAHIVLGTWLGKVHGLEGLPKDEPYIIAANHITTTDGILLASIFLLKLNKKLHFYVKSTYFDNIFLRHILELGECIPVYIKENKNSNLNNTAFEEALNYIKRTDSIGIFPEGAISFDARLRPAKPGLAKLALNSNAAIVPTAIIAKKIIGAKKLCPYFRGCEVRFGKPIRFNRNKNQSLVKQSEIIGSKVMKNISKLLKDG